MTTIIGISGRKRSGKDTAAERLVSHHVYTRFAFADIMRKAALALDPIIRIEPDEVGLVSEMHTDGFLSWSTRLDALVSRVGWERAKEVREVRRTLQRFGTEAGRNLYGEDFWVERTAAEIARHDGNVVLTDLRFPNEAEYVRSQGGLVVRVERPSLPQSTDLHPSETALDDYPFDVVLDNDSTIDALHDKVDAVAALVASRRA